MHLYCFINYVLKRYITMYICASVWSVRWARKRIPNVPARVWCGRRPAWAPPSARAGRPARRPRRRWRRPWSGPARPGRQSVCRPVPRTSSSTGRNWTCNNTKIYISSWRNLFKCTFTQEGSKYADIQVGTRRGNWAFILQVNNCFLLTKLVM